MKTREELIDEMAKAIYATGVALDGTDYAFGVHDDDDHFHRMASALIAANIGDVTEWKERAEKHRVQVLPDGTIKQLYGDEEVEDIARQRDEYKHRAEIAEKERDEYRKSTHIALRGIEILQRKILRYFTTEFPSILQQAEKELQEERKND